jgi:hypothetical protein
MFIQISRLGMLVSQSQPAYRLKMSKWPVVAYTHTHTHTHKYMAYIEYTYIHTCIHTYMHSYIYTYIHICIHAYIHTYIHTCMHTYIHAYIHTYIHVYRGVTFPSLRAQLKSGHKNRGAGLTKSQ